MGLLRQLFGPSKDEVWSQLAREIDGEYFKTGLLGRGAVRARVGAWTVTLDTYTRSAGKTHIPVTRMRAPFVNADGFRFRVRRAGFFDEAARAIGWTDVDVGDSGFDVEFHVKGSCENRIRRLFEDEQVKSLLRAQPRVNLEVRDDEGWFGADYPDGVDVLIFEATGIITDTEQLKQLFELFAAVLQRLCHIGSAYERDPRIEL